MAFGGGGVFNYLGCSGSFCAVVFFFLRRECGCKVAQLLSAPASSVPSATAAPQPTGAGSSRLPNPTASSSAPPWVPHRASWRPAIGVGRCFLVLKKIQSSQSVSDCDKRRAFWDSVV